MVFDLLGWISIGLCIVLLAKFFGRISKIEVVNKLLRVTHIPFGIAALIAGMVHGIFYIISEPHDVAENVTGIFLLAVMGLLAITYIAKKLLKSKWFFLHRLLSVVLIVLLIVHVVIVV